MPIKYKGLILGIVGTVGFVILVGGNVKQAIGASAFLGSISYTVGCIVQSEVNKNKKNK